MPLFSSLRKSRQLAKEHNAKIAEQKKQDDSAKLPYKHVPKHAASDAFASAPPGWREADRPRIVEQNRRRSAMMANGYHMNMPPISRVGSSLSHVSYPTEIASPMGRSSMPRSHSYAGTPAYPMNYTRDIVYSVPDLGDSHAVSMIKGKGVTGPEMMQNQGKYEAVATESMSGSTSSQDDLEMRAGRSAVRAGPGSPEMVPQLHYGYDRQLSDDSVGRRMKTSSLKSSFSTSRASTSYRDSRPPPSTRGLNAIPSAADPPPMQPGLLPGSLTPSSFAESSTRTSPAFDSQQGSAVSLTALSSAPAKYNTTTPPVGRYEPMDSVLISSNAPGNNGDITAEDGIGGPRANSTATSQSAKYKDRRAVKSTRFTELERIDSKAEPGYFGPSRAEPASVQASGPKEEAMNFFPEPQPEREEQPPAKAKGKRWSMNGGGGGGGKVLRKNRMAASKAIAA